MRWQMWSVYWQGDDGPHFRGKIPAVFAERACDILCDRDFGGSEIIRERLYAFPATHPVKTAKKRLPLPEKPSRTRRRADRLTPSLFDGI